MSWASRIRHTYCSVFLKCDLDKYEINSIKNYNSENAATLIYKYKLIL